MTPSLLCTVTVVSWPKNGTKSGVHCTMLSLISVRTHVDGVSLVADPQVGVDAMLVDV